MSTEITPNDQNESLKSFLQGEIREIELGLAELRKKIEEQNARGIKSWFRRLRYRINEDEFHTLENRFEDKSRRLHELDDEDVRLFLLRREIGILKEDVRFLGARRSWQFPTRAWVAIIALPFVIYFIWLAVLQGQNQETINTSATQTAAALSTMVPGPTWTPVATQIP